MVAIDSRVFISTARKGTNPYPPSEKVIQKIAQVCDRPVQEIYYLSGRIDPKDAEIARDLFKIYGDCFTKFLHKMHDDPNFADNIIEQLSAS